MNKPIENSEREKWHTNLGDCIIGISYSFDNSHLGVGTASGDVAIIALDNLKTTFIKNAHSQGVLCLEHSPTEYILATAGQDGTIKLWNT